jgi:hypothetical protein
MENKLNRLVADPKIIARIRDLSSCKNCHQIDIINGQYSTMCHSGIYCSRCLSLCSCPCKMMNATNTDLATQLQATKIRCSNLVYGCPTILPYEDIAQHELYCSYKPKISFPDVIFSSILQDPSFQKRNSQSQGLQNFDNLFESHDASTTHSEGNHSEELSSSIF